MSASSHSRRSSLAALLGVLALLVQALLPAAALAAQGRPDAPQIVICTAAGPLTLAKGGTAHGKGFAGLPCQDCLAASIAGLAATAPPSLPLPRIIGRVDLAPQMPERLTIARAPPRPPGQGPPRA